MQIQRLPVGAAHQGCAKIPKRSGIQDPQDPISGILTDSDPAFQVLSWYPGDLGSYMLILSRDPDGSWILLFTLPRDPGDLGSCIFTFSWDPGDLGS